MPATTASVSSPDPRVSIGPFDLDNEQAYRRWVDIKLERYPQDIEELIVEIRDPRALSAGEREALLGRCRKTNMAIYVDRRRKPVDKDAVRAFGAQLGLRRLDVNPCADENGISSVRVGAARDREYVPYTNRPLRWHTDGYYNPPTRTVRAFVMHCLHSAARGGENALLDPEIVYLLMRNENPAYIAALMQADVMTIPANTQQGEEMRGAQAGPVFSIDPSTGALHMRYTARTRSIAWKADPLTAAAVRYLERVLESCPYIFRYRLQPGEGLVCNNVLHNRTGFENDAGRGPERVLYRARYHDRIDGTSPHDALFEGKSDALA